MAGTLTHRQTEKARDLIKTERIVQELIRYIKNERKMEAGQVRACQILLDRTMPCLVAQSFSTDDQKALPMLTIVKPDDAAAA